MCNYPVIYYTNGEKREKGGPDNQLLFVLIPNPQARVLLLK